MAVRTLATRGGVNVRASALWLRHARFPPSPAPWRAEKIPGGLVVRDALGQALACVYSRATEADALVREPIVWAASSSVPEVIPTSERFFRSRKWHGFQFGDRVIGTRAITFSQTSRTMTA